MRAVVQRVSTALVSVNGSTVSRIESGLLVLLGIGRTDEQREVDWLAEKIVHLRVFEDEHGKMNRSVLDDGRALLVVSQFTLYGDARKGRRPSFLDACEPTRALPLYQAFCERCRALGVSVSEGVFGADMQVSLVNEGPVTIWLDTARP